MSCKRRVSARLVSRRRARGSCYRRDRRLAEALKAGKTVALRRASVESALWFRDGRRVRLALNRSVASVRVNSNDTITRLKIWMDRRRRNGPLICGEPVFGDARSVKLPGGGTSPTTEGGENCAACRPRLLASGDELGREGCVPRYGEWRQRWPGVFGLRSHVSATLPTLATVSALRILGVLIWMSVDSGITTK